MPRALLSVYDKTGLIEFASRLAGLGWDLIASGGTERALREAGFKVTPVETVTGTDEMLGGRVKTLHPAIHAGILVRDSQADLNQLEAHGYEPIRMVVCNLYPFQETVAKEGISIQDAVEQIDIGGVTLIRAAAKNFLHAVVVSDVNDYERIGDLLEQHGEIDIAVRRELAIKAFAHTRDYDTAIHAYLSQGTDAVELNEELPETLSLGLYRAQVLRYGENPHQQGAYYTRIANSGPLGGKVLGGKELSYNNILDLDAAWRAVSTYSRATVVIVKHLNPVGIASGNSIAEAYPHAFASDPVSAFGGVIAVNQTVDEAFVDTLGSLFLEAIVAPNFTSKAQAMLNEKRKNCRLLQVNSFYDGRDFEIKSVHRGFLVQRIDLGDPENSNYTVVSKRTPTTQELDALQFAWRAVQHVKSNAIVIANGYATLGVGGGLPSRVDAAKIAVEKAGERSRGAVLASDAFFPFADGIEVAAKAGITAIIQPGGSIRDSEVIQVADSADIAMIITGVRHFRH